MRARSRTSCLRLLPAIVWIAAVARAASSHPGGQPEQPVPIPSTGAHVAHATDGPLHKGLACDRCHDASAARGAPRPGVLLASFDGATCADEYCHGGFPGGNRGNKPVWNAAARAQAACGTCHMLPPQTGAHEAHTSATGPAIACTTCHQDPAFPSLHVNDAVDVAFGGRAEGGRFSGESCSNLHCHSDGRGRKVEVSWHGALQTCAACHDDETTAQPAMSGRHAFHLRIGVACADCHGTVVDRQKRIIDASLHANGRADVRVLAGRYSGGLCSPACHDQRSW